MREHPILFSGEMVRAILDGQKTQTRRVVKPQPPAGVSWDVVRPDDPYIPVDSRVFPGRWAFGGNCGAGWMENEIRNPYGEVGDRLWVRETFAYAESIISDNGRRAPIYRAGSVLADDPNMRAWSPSIHMPRWASRITLEIRDVRVERLNAITEQDARAEGCPYPAEWAGRHIDRDESARGWFVQLWNGINAKRGHSWEVNPFVWVIAFKRVAP